MSTDQGRSLSIIKMRVEELLTEVWGNEVQLAPNATDLKASGRTQVYRFSLLEKPVDAPQHIIVKAMPMTEGISEASNTAPENSFQLFFNDWAGLQFLSEIAPHPALAPRFYAGNKAHGLQALWRVIVPLALPGMVVALVLSFLTGWNDVLFASVLTSPETRTLAVQLQAFSSSQEGGALPLYGQLMGAVIVSALPVVILYMVFQRYLIGGLTAGGVKG
jgi:hypothetical protein